MNSAFKSIIIFLVGVLAGVVGHKYARKKYRSNNDGGPVITTSTDIKSLIEPNTIFGIDLSSYSGEVDWKSVSANKSVEYVIVRATMGTDRVDHRFAAHWKELIKLDLVRGAYHFFRPSEDLDQQFENFRSSVVLMKGDMRPILDIENSGDLTQKEIIAIVSKWRELCQKHWGVNPIIYTYLNFYKQNLINEVDPADLWLASYTKNSLRKSGLQCTVHQFSDAIAIKGLRERVDGNMFFGDSADFRQLCFN
jgi:lysozyme